MKSLPYQLASCSQSTVPRLNRVGPRSEPPRKPSLPPRVGAQRVAAADPMAQFGMARHSSATISAPDTTPRVPLGTAITADGAASAAVPSPRRRAPLESPCRDRRSQARSPRWPPFARCVPADSPVAQRPFRPESHPSTGTIREDPPVFRRRRVRSPRFTSLLAVAESAQEQPAVRFDFVASTPRHRPVADIRAAAPHSALPRPC